MEKPEVIFEIFKPYNLICKSVHTKGVPGGGSCSGCSFTTSAFPSLYAWVCG